MLSSSNGTGIVVHRLRTRSGGFIYLQSAGCLQYDRFTGKVDHFVCVGRMLPESEGFLEMQKFIRKFAPHVTSDTPSTLYHSLQMAISHKPLPQPQGPAASSSNSYPFLQNQQHQLTHFIESTPESASSSSSSSTTADVMPLAAAAASTSTAQQHQYQQHHQQELLLQSQSSKIQQLM